MKLTVRISCFLPTCLLLLVFSGCQSTTALSLPPASAAPLVDDDFFSGTRSDIESPEQIFTLPPDIKDQLRRLIAGYQSMPEKTKAVLQFILSYADHGVLYDNSDTHTAAETLHYRTANCLSLSILTYSLAREVNLETVFQDVLIPEYFSTQANQTWLNGHVNLRLKHSRINDNSTIVFGTDMIVDFDPYTIKRQFPAIPITRNRVVAMFYNNKAAVAYAKDNMAQTYAYYKAAVAADPDFYVTWANLGILYRTHGLMAEAEQAYLHSLELNPDSTNTLANLSYLYQLQGKNAQADSLQALVYSKRKSNPYYHIMLGQEAVRQNHFNPAITHFKKAISLDKLNHEAYFGLAKSYYLLNKPLQAESAMAKARQYAPTTEEKARYQKKLAILNQLVKR